MRPSRRGRSGVRGGGSLPTCRTYSSTVPSVGPVDDLAARWGAVGGHGALTPYHHGAKSSWLSPCALGRLRAGPSGGPALTGGERDRSFCVAEGYAPAPATRPSVPPCQGRGALGHGEGGPGSR